MSVMKELATELDLFWTPAPFGCRWSRELPDGQVVSVGSCPDGYRIGFSGDHPTLQVETLHGALVAVGAIARAQLAQMAQTWSISFDHQGEW